MGYLYTLSMDASMIVLACKGSPRGYPTWTFECNCFTVLDSILDLLTKKARQIRKGTTLEGPGRGFVKGPARGCSCHGCGPVGLPLSPVQRRKDARESQWLQLS